MENSHNMGDFENGSKGGTGSVIPAKYKIVFLGDQFVGKTSLINRFMYDTFEDVYQVLHKQIFILGNNRNWLFKQNNVRRWENS